MQAMSEDEQAAAMADGEVMEKWLETVDSAAWLNKHAVAKLRGARKIAGGVEARAVFYRNTETQVDCFHTAVPAKVQLC